MKPIRVSCGNCWAELSVALDGPRAAVDCPLCRAPIQVQVFPAFVQGPPEGAPAERVLLQDESCCFYHPENKAVAPCDACGRFLCALCDLPEGSSHLCPTCFARKQSGETGEMPLRIIRYDEIVLAVAVGFLIFFPFTIVTAPVALFMVVRYWKRPTGIIRPKRRWMFITAAVFASAELALWLVFLGTMVLALTGVIS
ncbi:MAG: hypothetical protein HYV26_22125 [Candidatus Hydrogenedentes bacterium]|nr:hypothetical protein [Candidatus Hydrogenedentota bacterium]